MLKLFLKIHSLCLSSEFRNSQEFKSFVILFQGQLVSTFIAKGERRPFQGQKEGISASGVLAGNGSESLGAGFRQAPMLRKRSTPKTEQSHW